MSKVSPFNAQTPIVDPATGRLTIAGLRLVNDLFARVGGTTAQTNIELATGVTGAQNTADTAASDAAAAQSTADGAATSASNAQTVATSALSATNALKAVPYVVVSLSGTVSDEREITAGENIGLTDGGAGSTLTVDLSRNPILKDNLGASLVQVSTGALGFYAATPIAKPTTAYTAGSFTANAGTAVNDASTFEGYTLRQVVKIIKDYGLLT